MRFPILYADHEWRQQRLIIAMLLVAGVAFGGQGLIQHQTSQLIWLGYIPFALLWAGFYQFRKRRTYVEASDDGIRIGRTFGTTTIDYDSIRAARVLPLRQLVPDVSAGGKKRYLPPAVKANLDTPSLILRFKGEPEAIAAITKELGSRLVIDGSAAFPLKEAETAAKEISRHLPNQTAGNLGGARRRTAQSRKRR